MSRFPGFPECTAAFSPLTRLLPGQATPELCKLQADLTARHSFREAARLLNALTPCARQNHTTTVARCMEEGLIGGQGFAGDASLISTDVQKQNSSNPEDWAAREIDPADAPRAVREYFDTLDDEAFGAATAAKPKFTAHADPASQWTAARKGLLSLPILTIIWTCHGIFPLL